MACYVNKDRLYILHKICHNTFDIDGNYHFKNYCSLVESGHSTFTSNNNDPLYQLVKSAILVLSYYFDCV